MEFKRGTQVHKGALIVFPKRTTEYGSIWELANGILAKSASGSEHESDGAYG
jgi:hypothetical protein